MRDLIKSDYFDKLIDCKGKELWRKGWCSNLIVENCDRLLAILMKKEQE